MEEIFTYGKAGLLWTNIIHMIALELIFDLIS